MAEKKAALDQVRDRLTRVGLGNLALDLHGANLKRKDILEQIGETLDQIRTVPPVQAEDLNRRFVEKRNKLREHVTYLHAKRPPSAMSAFCLQGLLLSTKPEEASSTRWSGQPLEQLTPDSIAEAGDLLQELAGFAGLFLGSDPSPWRGANLTDGAAVTRAVDAADHLAQDLWPRLKMAISDFVSEVRATPPQSLGKLRDLLEVQRRINTVLGEFDLSIFATELDQLEQSMRPAASFLADSYRGALTAGIAAPFVGSALCLARRPNRLRPCSSAFDLLLNSSMIGRTSPIEMLCLFRHNH